MGIKRSIEIAAEITGTKASRIAADAAMQQAERLLREDADIRPSTHKVKRGKQGATGRTRVERCRWEEVVDLNDEVDETVTHWGVVCHSKDNEWYVTTAAESENRMDLNTVQVRHRTDRIVGVMGFWEKRDLRFAPIGRAHRDWAVTDRMILGWSADKEYYFYRK